MTSIFRSEDVFFCQLIIPNESAYNVVRSIGELDCVQILNKNTDTPAFNRKFTQNILWCEEMDRKLRFLDDMMKAEKVKPFETALANVDAPNLNHFNEIENEINLIVEQINQSNSNLMELRKGYNELVEYRHVLRNSEKFDPRTNPTDSTEAAQNIHIIHGIIPRSRISQFENLSWRACRGNILMRHLPVDEEIQDPTTGEKINKCVFIVYLQGDQLVEKVRKICEAFQAPIYVVPVSQAEKNSTSIQLMTRIKDVELVLFQTTDNRKVLFNQVCKYFYVWRAKVLKIKAIFATLNQFSFDVGSRTLISECWCPAIYIDKVRNALNDIEAYESSDLSAILNIIETTRKPPTFYILNKISYGFQNLVDAYGIATYKEANPSLFMIITFPFLFAVMFGDFGHAIFIVVAGLYFVLNDKRLQKYKNSETIGMLYHGRYIILLMGLFSLYTGIIYNDIFSKSVYLWASSWSLPTPGSNCINELVSNSATTPVVLDPILCALPNPYPIGVDPPPPSILLTLINMFIGFNKPIPDSESLYSGQKTVQNAIVILALIALPWMLCVKPIVLILNKRKLPKSRILLSSNEFVPITEMEERSLITTSPPAISHDESDPHSSQNTGEILIMQLINTIEFSIGSLSNSASYLRLWALSLAHTQLSELLWSMVLYRGLIFTIIILVLMEGLSTFLHALRLHWVEFQSKFYSGDGTSLVIFSLRNIVERK
ncbi:hypothetical protein HZS_6627 [Henneguya salminicola]|nr:hypothetical protein HZS_6627 [Henneguya salminicola]